MECNKRNKDSPIKFWKTVLTRLLLVLEENAIQSEEDMAEYLYSKTSACGIFNAGFAAHVYRRFGGKGCRVLDPFAGWGDRMIAAVAVGCSEYQGYDTNDRIPYDEIKEALNTDAKLDVEIIPFERSTPKKDHYHVSLLSPPFFDYEIYLGGKTSTSEFAKLRSWNEGFWKPSLQLTLDAMKPGGHIFLYIPTGEDDIAKTMGRAVNEVYGDTTDYIGNIGYAQDVLNAPKMIRTALCYRKK